jgi:hypothetical protein
MAFDHTAITGKCSRLLRDPASGQQPSAVGVSHICVAQAANSYCVSSRVLAAGWVLALHHLTQQPPRLVSRTVGRPWGSMPTNCEPPLPTGGGPILEDVGGRLALPSHTEAGDSGIPDDLVWLKRSHLA